jgi:hypothetical protein
MLDHKAALAIVCGARPFSLFDESYMEDFVQSLDSSYQIPHRNIFTGRLLDEIYNATKEEVKEYIKGNSTSISSSMSLQIFYMTA